MRKIVALLLMCWFLMCGCDMPIQTLRFAPGESQKVSAQAADDIAAAAMSGGLPPGSEAAQMLAQATRAPRIYAGEPKEPLNVIPATSHAAEQWKTMEKGADAMKVRDKLRSKTTELVAKSLAELSESVSGRAQVEADQVVYRVQALAEVASVGFEVADDIEIPTAQPMSPEVKAQIATLKGALQVATNAAKAQAARRPTVKETADAAIDTVGGVADWLDQYGLLSLIPGGAVAGLWLNSARSKRKQQADADWDKEYEKQQEFAKMMAAQTQALLQAFTNKTA